MIMLAHQEHPELSMMHLCELHGVSRSWYYEQSTHPEQTTQEIALRDQIEDIILEFPGSGYRRVTHELTRQGWTINHKRVLRIMRSASHYCAISKRNL